MRSYFHVHVVGRGISVEAIDIVFNIRVAVRIEESTNLDGSV
jgi:hypothetical protein